MLGEFAVGDAPDFDIAPTELLSCGLEYWCVRSQLNRVAVRRRNGKARHDLVAIYDQVVDLHMHIGESSEISAKRCLGAGKSLSGAAVVLNVIVGDDIAKTIRIMRVEGSNVAFDQRRTLFLAGARTSAEARAHDAASATAPSAAWKA